VRALYAAGPVTAQPADADESVAPAGLPLQLFTLLYWEPYSCFDGEKQGRPVSDLYADELTLGMVPL
jgi:hypothetical protein